MSRLWMLLPDEFLPLVIAGIGLAVILQIMRIKAAAAMLGTIILLLLLSPFIDSLVSLLPLWMLLLVLVCVCVGVFKQLVQFIIGKSAADHMVGSLAAEAAKGIIKLLFLPFRILWLICRSRSRRNY